MTRPPYRIKTCQLSFHIMAKTKGDTEEEEVQAIGLTENLHKRHHHQLQHNQQPLHQRPQYRRLLQHHNRHNPCHQLAIHRSHKAPIHNLKLHNITTKMDIQVITTPLTHKTTTEVVTKVIGVAVVEEPTEATGVDTEELTVDKDST